jgi:hypothetical protein
MVECGVAGDGCRLSIRNAGVLPDGFDFDSGACAKTGLQLVRSMLPSRGTALAIGPLGSEVEASLWLQPPVLLVPAARGMHNPDFAGGG